MEGKKEFTNNTCFDLKIALTVRVADKPGCVLRIEEFCLRSSESKCIEFGNKCNPFLDGIRCCSSENGLLTECILLTNKCGTQVDKLLNTNNHIIIISAGPCLVVTGHC